MMLRIALLTLALLAGCSPQADAPATSSSSSETASAQAAAAVHPVSGLQVIPLSVASGGKVHRFQVEVAATQEAQARGLMFRTELGANEGMIFPNDPPEMRSFYMKNTPIPLDIIFIGTDRRILNIAAQTTPYSIASIPSAGPAINVLELRGGRAAELGIKAGDLVQW